MPFATQSTQCNFEVLSGCREGRAGKVDDTVFADDFAVDVIAETAVDIDFKNNNNAALCLHDHDLRICKAFMSILAHAGEQALNFIARCVHFRIMGLPNSPLRIRSLTWL